MKKLTRLTRLTSSTELFYLKPPADLTPPELVPSFCLSCGTRSVNFQISSHPTKCLNCCDSNLPEDKNLVTQYHKDWNKSNIVKCEVEDFPKKDVAHCWVNISDMRVLIEFESETFGAEVFKDLSIGDTFLFNVETMEVVMFANNKDYPPNYKDYPSEHFGTPIKTVRVGDYPEDDFVNQNCQKGRKAMEDDAWETIESWDENVFQPDFQPVKASNDKYDPGKSYKCQVDSVSIEDSGCALIANLVPIDDPDGTIFFRIQSWSEEKKHDEFPFKEGQTITIKVSNPED